MLTTTAVGIDAVAKRNVRTVVTGDKTTGLFEEKLRGRTAASRAILVFAGVYRLRLDLGERAETVGGAARCERLAL